MSWLALIIITTALGLGSQAYIKRTYKKWNRVPISSGMTGAQAARRMLDANGLVHVAIDRTPGELTDHYNPKTNVVSLSDAVYSSTSVSATAIACHECGHAVQHAQNYAPAKLRGALVPAVNIASNAWMFVFFAAIFFQIIGLFWVAIALFAATLIFQVVTLPVEFDASRRALAYVNGYGFLPATETKGARSVLTSAALTYVAAALASIMQLIYLLGSRR
jgi:Zn-dependent membrane protease YugP